MDLTDIPEDAVGDGEETASPPDLDGLDSPETLLTDGPIRERLLDVVTTLRTPTRVAAIADAADCDPTTAREYLRWFHEMGIVHRHEGRPVQYERNDAYFRWRRVDRIRETYTEDEIVAALSEVLDEIHEYRERFGAEDPAAVSLVQASRETSTEAAWEALSEWETLERRAELLEEARRARAGPGSAPGSADA